MPLTLDDYVIEEPRRPVWYRRTSFAVAIAVVVVIIASVLVDLPSHTTPAADIAAQSDVMNQINSDIAGCAYAAQETFTILEDLRTGLLTTSDRSEAPSMLRDDQTACSFTSGSIYDLSNVEGTGSAAGKRIGDIVDLATTWATSDALAAIEDIQNIYSGQASNSTNANLSHEEVLLGEDRATAIADVAAADRILHARLPQPNLPNLPHLAGT